MAGSQDNTFANSGDSHNQASGGMVNVGLRDANMGLNFGNDSTSGGGTISTVFGDTISGGGKSTIGSFKMLLIAGAALAVILFVRRRKK
ncbi:hypothetical protein FACS1894186_4290 [Alphaproteobacteria bacterium]|nr:hypothetical protein FACS1894186_4290 [Alphaproteobacteria bacterium]